MVKKIDDELFEKLQKTVGIHTLTNQKTLHELKDTVDEFYKHFLEALD